MCEAGESGGMLDEVLNRLAEFAEADNEMRSKIKGALMMPVIQMVLATLGVVFLLVYIFPKFAKMFKKMKADLPGITKFMITCSDTLRHNYIMVIIGVAAVVGGWYAFARTDAGKKLIAQFSMKAPIVGNLNKQIAVSRFARTFCSLLGAGVPILQALQITGSVMGNPIMEEEVLSMATTVQGGNTLASTLDRVSFFPPMVKKMIEVGENTGNLDVMLSKAADFYEREVKEALAGLTAAITPIMTVIMGIIIGTIAMSVFLPMFKMTDAVK